MRRVASRPRLFSWDQFDATATDHPDGIFDEEEDQEEGSSIAFNGGGGPNDNDHDSDYMSCISQSFHSSRRFSNGNYIAYGGPSRSSSMLSLKNWSAHAYLQDEEEECSSCKEDDAAAMDGMKGDEFMLLLDTDSEDASCVALSDSHNNSRCGLDRTTPLPQHREAHVVSPPGTPRCSSVDVNRSTFLLDFVSTGQQSNKKRNLDAFEKSVFFPRLFDQDFKVVSGGNTAIVAAAAAGDDDAGDAFATTFSCITATDTTTTTTATNTVAPFNLLAALHQDVLIDSLEYLSLDDLKSLSITCSTFYHLLTFGTMRKRRNQTTKKNEDNQEAVSGIRNVLWWNWMRRQWPDLALAPTQDGGENCDSMFLSSRMVGSSAPPSLSSPSMMHGVTVLKPCHVQFVDRKLEHHGCMNYIALMSQSQSSPTCIAPKYFEERSAPPNLITLPVEQTRPPLFRSYYNNKTMQEGLDGVQIVQYIGDVGIGDRSICTNRPFPRPRNDRKKWNRKGVSHHSMTSGFCSFPPSSPIARLHGLPQHIHNLIQEQRELASNSHKNRLNIFERLRGCHMYNHSVGAVIEGKQPHLNRRSGEDTEMEKGPQPFVSPYVSSMKLCVEIDLTPRMMAYFEVSILRKDNLNLNAGKDEVDAGWSSYRMQTRPRMARVDDRDVRQNQNEVHSACVAVGLSTQGFYDSSRMPGWDSSSYGYHGDDGGIFHSHGEMIRVYGPTYNVGDTVGCGVNYSNGGIFYTLNGNFLGYAWVNEKIVMDGEIDLYPTIGLDSGDPIACNFGNRRPFVFNFAGFVANDGNMPISGPIGGNP